MGDYARRQVIPDGKEPLPHGGSDCPAVFTGQHQRRTDDDFTSILACCAGAELSSDAQLCDITYRDGNAVVGCYDRMADFAHRVDARIGVHEISFASALNI